VAKEFTAMSIARRDFLTAFLGSAAATCVARSVLADQPGLVEPVHRVASAAASAGPNAPPLDVALRIAQEGLAQCREHVVDYTATLVKRERVDGNVGEHEYMFLKVRNRKVNNGQITQPLSVYLTYLRPTSVKGREVIYVLKLRFLSISCPAFVKS
jgi:hypothetical protein